VYPNQFDADSQIQYKTQQAARTAERHRLARLAAAPGVNGRWQAHLGALREASAARRAGWSAAVRGAALRLRAVRASLRKPREECC